MNIRIIPRLDIKGPNLVKGIQMEGLRVLGTPYQFAEEYYQSGADELIYMDVVASLYGRNNLLSLIELTAQDVFIPITVGGGIRSVDDVRRILRSGADKVSVNTAAVQRPELITEISRTFGSSTVVVSIEAKKTGEYEYEAYVDYGREATGVDAIEWAKRVEQLGAGEILITCIDRDGSGYGFDLDLTRMVSDAVSVPVIASGGAGAVDHFPQVVIQGHADAVSAASVFHYEVYSSLDQELNIDEEGNREFLRSGASNSRVQPFGIADAKNGLFMNSIPCRMVGY